MDETDGKDDVCHITFSKGAKTSVSREVFRQVHEAVLGLHRRHNP